MKLPELYTRLVSEKEGEIHDATHYNIFSSFEHIVMVNSVEQMHDQDPAFFEENTEKIRLFIRTVTLSTVLELAIARVERSKIGMTTILSKEENDELIFEEVKELFESMVNLKREEVN